MLCWPEPLQAQPVSHPNRALHARRLEQEVLLLRDLEQGQRTWYRRSDGGFHLPLARDNVNALVIAADQLDVLAGLSDSNWRVMALDPAGVVLGLASHAPCQPAIARMLRELVAAEWGEPKVGHTAGGGARPHINLWNLPGGRPDSSETLSRSRLCSHSAIRSQPSEQFGPSGKPPIPPTCRIIWSAASLRSWPTNDGKQGISASFDKRRFSHPAAGCMPRRAGRGVIASIRNNCSIERDSLTWLPSFAAQRRKAPRLRLTWTRTPPRR
jgi:hypothetical protein